MMWVSLNQQRLECPITATAILKALGIYRLIGSKITPKRVDLQPHLTAMTEHLQQQPKTKKRKDRRTDKVKAAYASLKFRELPVADPPLPGTPHMLFQKSFVEEGSRMQIHQHANGLCIVTAGSALNECPVSIEFQVKEAAQGETKKVKKNKPARQESGQEGFVAPSDTLLVVESKDGTTSRLPCCVLGLVMELNTQLQPDLLFKDPLLKGYLAVIQPSGPFPPPNEE